MDNNASLHAAGATVLAHENTKKRMSEMHDLLVLGLHFPPSPAEALLQQSFATTRKLQANGETLQLEHFAPAHTDTDLFVHFQKANVIHMGDTFFNVIYPYIDGGTGGNVSGMIAAADKFCRSRMTPRRSSSATGRWAEKPIWSSSATCWSLCATASRR